MHDINKNEPDQSSVHSPTPCTTSYPSWWHPTGPQIPQPSFCKSLNLNSNSPTQHSHNMKHLGGNVQDQDSSSTQSTGQSHHSVVNTSGGDHRGQCISGQSGFNGTHGKQVSADGHTKSTLPLGSPDFGYPSLQVDYSQTVTHVPHTYVDPFFYGMVASYGPQTIIQSQMLGMPTGRVPLPLNLQEDGPIFVNAKQYRGIIRRRQFRAKQEAQNKLVKNRKPYLHESRHRHAVNRPRGSGGRFLNAKKPQQCKQADSNNGSDPVLQLGGGMLELEEPQSENSNIGASATCSDVTSVSNNNDILRQPDLGHPTFVSNAGGGGIGRNGSQNRHPAAQ